MWQPIAMIVAGLGSRAVQAAFESLEVSRREHSLGVERAARDLVSRNPLLPDLLIDAARLHDVGYARAASVTGFHQLDGANFLASFGADRAIVGLVAFHTGSEFEAEQHGLLDQLNSIERPAQSWIDAITICDMTTGPNGARLSPQQRLSEILQRYPDDHLVHKAISNASETLLSCCRRAREAADLPDEWLGAAL